MRLRTFQAATMSEAMRLVREALGDDAIIVSTHQSGRGRGVQLTAAVEDELELELEAGGSAVPEPDVATGALADVMSFHGVPERIAARLRRAADSLPVDDPVEALAGALDQYYDFEPIDFGAEGIGRRRIALVGPPGAGKTVAVAKLATHLAVGDGSATIVTTDILKAGAVAQLEGYASVLGMPLLSVEDPSGLKARLQEQPAERPVLIDTPGTNPFSGDELDDLRRFLAAGQIEPVLVLAAGGDVEEGAEIAAAFARLGCRRVIYTRIDGARRLGALLSATEAGRFAFTEVSITPSVAQGLKPITPLSLARVLTRDPLQRPDVSLAGARTA
ncbi:MAG TPA: hypothetical protein VE631_02210, partial [Alphaproteobacteria bacterium]|nr:hypothetical protein [Alphaproteobacteria bacterium]